MNKKTFIIFIAVLLVAGGLIFANKKKNNKDQVYTENTTKTKLFKGKLSLGHESEFFTPCNAEGADADMWVLDKDNLLGDQYEKLTQGKEPYTAVYAEIQGESEVNKNSQGGFDEEFNTLLHVKSLVNMEDLSMHPECK